VLKRRTPKVVHRAKVAFRQAVSTRLKSNSYLGAQYRRLRTRLGAPKAITAMARKLACLFYRLLTKGHPYVDKGAACYESCHREQQVRSILRRAAQLGLKVLPPEGQAA
jgi:transposase